MVRMQLTMAGHHLGLARALPVLDEAGAAAERGREGHDLAG
jgi:hypothetical protein